MAFIKRINYLASFTTLFVLTGICLALLIIFILYIKFSDFKQELDKEKAFHEFSLKKEKITEFYSEYSNIVLSIQHNRFFTSYLDNPDVDKKENLKILFETIVEQKKTINQLRYISENGFEIIRVDRKKSSGEIEVIEETKLQNKSHRDYFISTMGNKPSEIYISSLDLNIENKKIEIPYKPVLRFSIPVYNKLNKKGIVIVNIFGKSLLKDLVDSNSFNTIIYDQNNHILVSNMPNVNSWTRYLGEKSSLKKNQFIYSDILIQNGTKETLYIGFAPKGWVESFFKMADSSILFILLFIIVIGFVLAYMLSRIPKDLFDELESQQNMLIQQSKVSAMGEMTGMLAHQWRQPLNTISVLLQEIEIKKSMNILNDKEFGSLSSKMKETITHMSKTIDDFRDFFKVTKQKSKFNIKETIESVCSILEVKLNKNHIKCDIKVSNSLDKSLLEIESYEGEFKQVIINILSNAIEGLEDKEIEYRYISISMYQNGKRLNISIEDNGGGIKKTMLNKLFEPYSSSKLEKNGTGLGLYMAKMIVQKSLNGRIEAQNTNKGARFTIFL